MVVLLLILNRCKNTYFIQISQIFYKKYLILNHVNVSLWEWDADVVLVEGIVDALQHVADD
jgi:hypothetical protein